MGFNFLHAKLMGLWKPAGESTWFPSVAVWVRLYELPIEYYEVEVLQQIGGNSASLDMHTTTEARGRYARICVQVDISKPLITSVRIGQRNQPVVYEGVSKLCFSCGWLGHRKETCQYTIKPPSPPPKESKVLNDAKITSQTPTMSEAQTKAQTKDHNSLDSVDSDASFGPQMVVSRKRNDNKRVKQNSPSSLPGNGKTHHQEKQIEPLKNSSVKKVWAGPSKVKESNGKRKAELDLIISPTLSTSPLDEHLTTFLSGLVSTSSGQNPIESMGRSSKDLNKHEPKTNSVKGKKEFAHNKALLPTYITAASDKATFILAASDKTSFSTPTDWSTSISKLRTKLNGEFKFGAKPNNKMGNQRGRVDCGDFEGDCRGNPSLPNTPMG
ncbi:uncharacterized protein LOC126701193 [Quercus robur]|uniref:uncharacterized protein LOC126701193 n=1 Tax=Quercus robur TaxID=38942 RepID=UPI002162C41E|nr:uncharacterized protein LOC126701193 [Quercus robur]